MRNLRPVERVVEFEALVAQLRPVASIQVVVL